VLAGRLLGMKMNEDDDIFGPTTPPSPQCSVSLNTVHSTVWELRYSAQSDPRLLALRVLD